MNKISEYQRLLEYQCEQIILNLNGINDIVKCKKYYNLICQKLSSDFLPPIDREDIVCISVSLLDICYRLKLTNVNNEFLVSQINDYKGIVGGLFLKRKTCGDEIRRLIENNFIFKCSNNEVMHINRMIGELLKITVVIYFKNL